METYNPRNNSFIKQPEPKTCPTCGQLIQPEIKPMNNHMNVYVNDISGRETVMNSNEAFVEVQGVKLRRNDVPKITADTKVEGQPLPPKTSSPILTQQTAIKPK